VDESLQNIAPFDPLMRTRTIAVVKLLKAFFADRTDPGSAIALAFGARIGVLVTSIPSVSKMRCTQFASEAPQQ